MTALIGSSADWYLMRASGFVSLTLLTLTACLGVANVARAAKTPRTRTVLALVHRNVSLLTVAFVAVHIVTAISDRYVSVPALAIIVPGASRYDPFWVGLGAVTLDLALAVVVTSLLRGRIGVRAWRGVHWLAYLTWPTALLHALGSGSGAGADTGARWSTLIYLAAAAAFTAAVTYRWRCRARPPVEPASPQHQPRYRPPALPPRPGPAGPAPATAAGGGLRPAAAPGRARPAALTGPAPSDVARARSRAAHPSTRTLPGAG